MPDRRPARVLVVGASSGIGAGVARAVVAEGGKVALAARRSERLQALVEELGCGFPVMGDAGDAEQARGLVDQAAEAMGGLDLVVYAAGYGPLQRLAETTPDTWTDVYRVNVIGANLIAGASLAHLDHRGIVAFVSSRTVEDSNAYFAPYSASKAALDQSIRSWRVEHPEHRFVRVVMGNCQPTEFDQHMGLDLLDAAITAWGAQGIPGGLMHVDDVGRALIGSLAVSLAHPDIDMPEIKMDARVRPR